MLAFKISAHLSKLAGKHPEIKRQFYLSSSAQSNNSVGEKKDKSGSLLPESFLDPLIEEKFSPVKGLVHKYPNRVLILLTMNCSAYCRFCTRQRSVSEIKEGLITENDLGKMITYLRKHPEINEVILSGGDPLVAPKILKMALNQFSRLSQIKIIRIGTRVPVSEPKLVTDGLLEAIKRIRQPVYVMIHFEHPAELTLETEKALKKLRKAGCILLSQSVFLKGVNDRVEILEKLFNQLLEIGVKPYYIFRCDPVQGSEEFWVKPEKEIEIMTQLRKRLSGLACPTYVIDTPNGSGKIPVPLDFWEFKKNQYQDFKGKWQKVIR